MDVASRCKQLLIDLKDLASSALRDAVKREPEEVQRAFWQAKKDAYFVPANLLASREPVRSPSGRYALVVSTYRTEGGWNYSRGCVYRAEGAVLLADVRRNYLVPRVKLATWVVGAEDIDQVLRESAQTGSVLVAFIGERGLVLREVFRHRSDGLLS